MILNKLKRSSIFSFIFMSILFIINFIFIFYLINNSIYFEKIISNLSHDKFLVQETLFLSNIKSNDNSNLKRLEELKEELKRMHRNRVYLKDIYLIFDKQNISQKLSIYLSNLELLLSNKDGSNIKSLNTSGIILSDNLSIIISYIKKECRSSTDSIRTYSLITFFISVFSLIFIYYKVVLKTLNKSEEIYRDLENYIEILDDNIIISKTDKKGIITYASKAFCDISGYSLDELMGKPHNIVRHKDMSKLAFKDLWETIQEGQSWQGEVKNRKKDGGFYWVLATISPIFNKNGDIKGYTSIRQDITTKKRVEQLSITDDLTALFNRRYFNSIAPTLVEEVKLKRKEFLCLAIIDLDRFKNYNDTYGHQLGDEVLIKVGKVLNIVTSNIVTFRLGGEEFGLLMTSENLDDILNKIESLRKEIENLSIEHIKNMPFGVVTASFGACILDKNSEIDNFDIGVLYKLADKELYSSKGEGRNRVSINY